MTSKADLLVAFYCRMLDRLAIEISREFDAAGIDHALLKGAAIAGWLYDQDELRSYADVDFLVPAGEWNRSHATLRALGFRDAMATMAHPRMESFGSHPWSSSRGDVDMHATLEGLDADPETVWRELTAESEFVVLPEGRVRALPKPARLLHVALHAAQHRDGKAIDDLRRAFDRLTDDEWLAAAELAERLEGLPAFLSGVRAHPAGDALITRLGLREAKSVHTLLRAGQVPLAEGLHELSRARGLRAKVALGAREVAPSREFMRWWSPLARRGPAGLAAAYAWRPLYLLSRLPGAALALRRARRSAD